jgi:hypothetical protein
MAKTTAEGISVNSLVYERNVKYFLHGIRKPTGKVSLLKLSKREVTNVIGLFVCNKIFIIP